MGYLFCLFLHVSLVCFHCHSKRYPCIQNKHENKKIIQTFKFWSTCNTVVIMCAPNLQHVKHTVMFCFSVKTASARGREVTLLPCVLSLTLSCCSLLHSPQTRLFRQLMVACVSSTPCSPCWDNPNPHLWIYGTQCDSSRCCFGMTRTSGNSLR